MKHRSLGYYGTCGTLCYV